MALITLNRSPVCSVRPSVILPAPWPTGVSRWPKAPTLTNNGPTIARELRETLDVCYHMARRAQRLAAHGTPSERGLLDALVERYQSPEPQALTELARWNDARKLHAPAGGVCVMRAFRVQWRWHTTPTIAATTG